MLGKQAIIEFFRKNNINNIFHLPGIHTIPFNDCLAGSNINVFMGRHEANIAFMADGYARASGKTGVVVVTPGPGLGNIVSGCMEAYGDDVPILFIHVDIKKEEKGKGALHEIREPERIFTNFSKKTFVVQRNDELTPMLEDAYMTTISGRRGPVIISVPHTLFEKQIPGKVKGEMWKVESGKLEIGNRKSEIGSQDGRWKGGDAGEAGNQKSEISGQWSEIEGANKEERINHNISKLEEALRGKKRPVIIGGRSLMFEEARPFLEEICGEASIPFLTTTSGKGIVRDDDHYAFGNIVQKGVVRDILISSDIVIALGTRLRDTDAKRRGVKIRDLIHIDIDDRWIGRSYPSKLQITGDLCGPLKDLKKIFQGKRFEWDLHDLKKRQNKEHVLLEQKSPGFKAIKLIRECIPQETTTVSDLNYPSYWAEYYFPVYHQNTFIMPRGISPIFYSFPASIGAKIGRPDRPCLCLAGDGGFLPTMEELSTIERYNIAVVLLVYNNNSYGILEEAMIERCGVAGAMECKNPDFIRIARAFGIKAKKTRTLNGLRNILLRDVSWNEPFLIEFESPVFPTPWNV